MTMMQLNTILVDFLSFKKKKLSFDFFGIMTCGNKIHFFQTYFFKASMLISMS